MASVALNDGISFRRRAELVCAQEQVQLSGILLGRFSSELIAFCEAALEHSRDISEQPAVEPLNAGFFRGHTAQQAASWNGFLHSVLFGGRFRFSQKLRILCGTLRRLDREFRETAAALSAGTAVDPGACWHRLDCLHFDLNTCLGEAEIVLKSVLSALPAGRIAAFAAELDAAPEPQRAAAKQRLSDATA
jgi:hypothetical protein